MATNKVLRREKIKRGIRKNISGTAEKPRLSVFRSNSGIFAQIIDDISGKTLASVSTNKESDKVSKSDKSKSLGTSLAKIAIEKGITTVVFDRGGYLFHGRVKALAEGAREGGLKF